MNNKENAPKTTVRFEKNPSRIEITKEKNIYRLVLGEEMIRDYAFVYKDAKKLYEERKIDTVEMIQISRIMLERTGYTPKKLLEFTV